MNDDELAVLSGGLDQMAALLEQVSEQQLSDPTPCLTWSVADLVDHVVAAPGRFARLVGGHEVDWSAETPHVGADRVAAFRAGADELRAAWSLADPAPRVPRPGPDWQSAEIAVHTWDLASALGRPTVTFDQVVAERGLAFMRANLTPDNRGAAFGPEQTAPDDADAYQQIAAFAGRQVSSTPSG